MKKSMYLLSGIMLMAMMSFSSMALATNLCISKAAATKVFNIIDNFSTVALILSIVAAIIGAGLLTAGMVATAKYLARKFGKAYAIAW